MTDRTNARVSELLRALQRHRATLSIALAIDDSLALAIATLRGRSVVRSLKDLICARGVGDGALTAIERTMADYERLQDTGSVMAIGGQDRVRMLRWLEHRSRHALDLFESRVQDQQLGLLSFFELSMLECRFERVAMAGSYFVGSSVGNCEFQGSDLRRTIWEDARVSRCNFDDVDLSDASLDGTTFIDCTFRHAELASSRDEPTATARRARFVRCDLRNTNWKDRPVIGTSFDACRFHGAHGRPRLESVEIDRPDLSPLGDGSAIGAARDVISIWTGPIS